MPEPTPPSDLPKPRESQSKWKPRLFFHISGTGATGLDSIRRIGLLADKPTLTPLLDVANDYSGGDVLTFWYPKRGEVDQDRSAIVHTPTTEVTPAMKAEMERTVDDLNLDSWQSNAIKRAISGAETYLPSDRLRAFTKLKYGEAGNLLAAMPAEHDVLEKFATNRAEIVAKVEAKLGTMDLTIIDDSLTKQQLADDITRAYFEHTLLNLNNVGSREIAMKASLESLQSVTFQEPEYERYRTNLISRFTRKLNKTSPHDNEPTQIK